MPRCRASKSRREREKVKRRLLRAAQRLKSISSISESLSSQPSPDTKVDETSEEDFLQIDGREFSDTD